VSKFEVLETQFERTVNCHYQSLVKPTWSWKMTVLSTFLESSLNFLFHNLKKHYQIWYSQGEKRCQVWTARNSLKEQSKTKSLVKPTWNEKMTVLNIFLESSLNVLFNNLKSLQKLHSQGKKRCQGKKKFEPPEIWFERTVNCHCQSLVKPTWSYKMTVLSTFLEFSLNFLFN